MNKRTTFVLLLLIAFACQSKHELVKVIEDTYQDGTPYIIRYYQTEKKEVLVKETTYYQSGKKKIEGNFKNGKREGLWRAWFPDGTLWSEGEYREGEEMGLKTVYYENGNKFFSGKIQNGKRKGEWSFWDKEGKLLKKITY
jgi:antitoxin component YwqK of YwqJK toxin-antitoxin module